jgi:hypothetical protein
MLLQALALALRAAPPRRSYVAEPAHALDANPLTFWSSVGGAVCCTESTPAWLLVSLGPPRAIATLQLVLLQDMTFTLAVANASDAAMSSWVTVASSVCEKCRTNEFTYLHATFDVTRGGRPVVASHVKLTITWSSGGGIGACADLCDWATDVYELRALSAGALPAAPPPPQALLPPPGCAVPPARRVLTQSADGVGAARRGAAALGSPVADAAAHDDRRLSAERAAVLLTPPVPASSGSVEFLRVLRPGADCDGTGCSAQYGMFVSAYVWLGGAGGSSAGGMPGEGLVMSLVDASRQTPGATVYVSGGCGMRAALPLYALSIVFDSAEGRAEEGCDEPGTGMRVVSTLLGPDVPPHVVGATLEMSTRAFRRGAWLPLQFQLARIAGTWCAQTIFLDGLNVLDGYRVGLTPQQMAAGNITMDALYLVASARTGAASSDAHALSGLRVECLSYETPQPEWVENDAALRQPLTPPPSPGAAGGWRRPPQPPQQQQVLRAAAPPRAVHVLRGFAAGFAPAFCATLAALGCIAAACVCQQRCARAAADDAAPPLPVCGVPHNAGAAAFDVFLSYRRADWRLADAVQDKLRLRGLRVFKDVDGFMAGRPFDAALMCAVHSAPVFAPLVTLASLRRLAAAVDANAADTSLAEYVAALYCRDVERSVARVEPLLAGPEVPLRAAARAASGAAAPPQRWCALTQEPEYGALLAALPDAVPVATMALVDAALRTARGVALPPAFASLTVRQVLLGRDGSGVHPAVVGALAGEPFELACAQVRACVAAVRVSFVCPLCACS